MRALGLAVLLGLMPALAQEPGIGSGATDPSPDPSAGAASSGSPALDALVRDALAPVLASWITGARNEALQRGVAVIPAEIRAVLDGYVPSAVLDRARWRVDDGVISVQQSLFRLGYTPAVTLDQVIVFAAVAGAADPRLWAHELVHVRQYRDWGVEGFVARYLADYAAVEHEASEFRWQWMKATGRIPRVPDPAATHR